MWTQKINLSKQELQVTFDRLRKAISSPHWPIANYTNVSGHTLNCECWQGKVIQIGCSSLRKKICKEKCRYEPFYKSAKWQISNTGTVCNNFVTLSLRIVHYN